MKNIILSIDNNKLKSKVIGILSFLIFSCCLLIGCPTPFHESINNAGYGTVRIGFTGDAWQSRTVFPATNAFDKLEYFFTKQGGSTEEKTSTNGMFTLEIGSYTVLVKAYIGSKQVANGSTEQAFSVGSGATVNLTITLIPTASALTGSGTFKYHITYPTGTTIKESKLDNLLSPFNSIDLNATSLSGGTVLDQTHSNIPAGYYLLTIIMTKDGKVAGKNEVIHIYDGLISTYSLAFEDAYFIGPIINILDISTYLAMQPGGNDVNDPINLMLGIDLGNMLQANSGWQQLLGIIGNANKYINLDLSACTMNGNVFIPANTISTGKDRIVSIIMPIVAEVITGSSTSTACISSFRYFSHLTNVTGINILLIGNDAFYECTNLISVDFHAATNIGIRAFESTSLINVDFPNVIEIGEAAFRRCSNLIRVNFPEATTIGSSAFSICSNLSNTNFPKVTKIGGGAFYYCTSLINIKLPVANAIDIVAFRMCTNLINISFPATASIGYGAFAGCVNLSFNLIGSGHLSVIEYGKVLVSYNSMLVAYPSASGSIVMNSITNILDGAFYECEGITSVSFPFTTNIESFAFNHCINLLSVNFPVAIKIGNNAFNFCYNMQSISFPEVINIEEKAFSQCGLQSVSFPEAIEISPSAFGSCTNLTNINFPKVTYIRSEAFSYCPNLINVNFPVASVVNNGAFRNCTSLSSVNLPLVTFIQGENSYSSGVFYSCTNLVSISFPIVTSIGNSTFSGCNNLNTITIRGGLTSSDIGFIQNSVRFDAFTNYYLGAGAAQAGIYTWNTVSWVFTAPLP